MSSPKLYSTLLPPQPWELNACASAGLTISQFRFTVAFLLSVLVGAFLRVVPRRGEPAQSDGAGEPGRSAAAGRGGAASLSPLLTQRSLGGW